MTHIVEAQSSELVKQAGVELKNQKLIQPPVWSKFVKTGMAKERLPEDPDWWYFRAASVLKTIAKLGPIGTQKLRVKYGSRKNRGHKPEKFYPASGAVLRNILQQLEKSGLLTKTEKGVHKGRILAPKGVSFLDKIAVQIVKKQQQEE